MKEKLTFIPNDLVSLKDYERYAKERMDLNSIAYICSGAGDEITYKKNEKAFENIFLERLKSEDITPTAPYNIYDDLDIDRKLGDDILKSLTAKKDVIRLQHNLFIHSQSLNKIIKSMREIIKEDSFIEIFNFKQRFDLSRKYLVCYLDYLDNFSDIKKVENRRVFS